MRTSFGTRSIGWFCAILLLTAFVYWPNLNGGYVFDDYPNIVDNAALHLTSLDWTSLRDAALSSPAKELIRPLSMMSFAMDWYFGQGDPHRMKVVNLTIHLLNGLLLFFLIRQIAHAVRRCAHAEPVTENSADILALCVSAAWLLSPINFTAVGYIVQRMESLCQIFVLAGLLTYMIGRQRMLERNSGVGVPVIAIVAGVGLGFLAKESAVLLPCYSLVLEWVLYGFRRKDGKPDKRIYAMYVLFLAVPALVGGSWLLDHFASPHAWIGRSFTLAQRLLTEPRVLVDYIFWSLLPEPGRLALYHDNIVISKGLFDPPSTFVSMVLLLTAACFAIFLKRSRPLAAIGILWFLAAHLLTGTFIPLELVFEHRNYFASSGIYLAAFAGLFSIHRSTLHTRVLASILFILFLAGVTWIRAIDWGNPIIFAISEAQKNPNSPRTAYELGTTYVILSRYRPDSPLIALATGTLEQAAAMAGADALPDQALLILSGNLKRPISDDIWTRLQKKLANQPLSVQNISALYSLTQCSIKQLCSFPPTEMIASFAAALSHEPVNASVLSIYANYALNGLHDVSFAVELEQSAVAQSPHDLQMRINLLALLMAEGRNDDARRLYHETSREIPNAERDPHFKAWMTTFGDAEP